MRAPFQQLTRLRRYVVIYEALWRNSVVREMSFKGNFLLWIVVEVLWFALQLCFIGVIYLHTDHIATWTKWQVVLLVGASHFIQQIFQAFFLTNCTQLSELIRTGQLDFMLLLPVNTRFLVSLRQVDLGGFVNAASGAGGDGLRGPAIAPATPSAAQVAVLLAVVRGGRPDPLFADVPAGERGVLDRAGAGDRVGLLQPLQHRAAAGRGVPRDFSRPSSPSPCRCCWWPTCPPSSCSTV